MIPVQEVEGSVPVVVLETLQVFSSSVVVVQFSLAEFSVFCEGGVSLGFPFLFSQLFFVCQLLVS